ncbi:MAG: helix-turn-helix domain-containing protein, partial [Erysipelotrichaceae bacterium]|nr:helix-turn-helix domain-containing protein [Erysipelotrichaceae bacterium]
LDSLFRTEDRFEGFRGTVANADRATILLYYILSRDESITTEELANRFYVSVSTIKKNLYYIRDILKRFDLALVSRRQEGLRVEGREHDMRMCINYILNSQRKYSEEDSTEGMRSILDPQTTREVEKVIYNVIQHEKRSAYSFQAIHFLAKLVRISVLRNQAGHTLEEYDNITGNLYSSRDSFVLAKRILKECEILLDTEFTAEDSLMLSICMVGTRVIVRIDSTYESNYLQAKNTAYELVEYLDEMNCSRELLRDTELVGDIAGRMESMRTRAQYHICQSNITGFFSQPPLFAHKLAVQSVLYLQEHHQMEICSDNIDILTTLFHQRHSYQKNNLPRFTCCLATLYDLHFAQDYARELQMQLDNLVDRIEVRDLTGTATADFESYDVIFTFKPISDRYPFPAGKPLLIISSLYPEDAAVQFRQWCALEILHIDTRSLFEHIPVKIMQARDQWQCLLQIAGDICPDDQESCVADLMLMQQTCADEPYDNVVIITGIRPNCEDITIRVYVLKKPVVWGQTENRAQLVVYWDQGIKDNNVGYFYNEYLTRLLQRVFRNRMLVSSIISTCSTEGLAGAILALEPEVMENIFRHIER